MKNIFTLILLALATFCAAQSNQVKTPGVSYSAGAPNWVPVVKTASELAIDTVAKRMYLWNRNTGAWDLQGQGIDNTSGGTPPAYTPGQTDSKFAINNASPPELYVWTGLAWAKVGGTIQTIDTFSVSGSVVSLSLTQDNQPAKTITLPASGITALTGDVTATGPGSAAATIAAGAVTGAKLAANSVDSTKVTARSIAGSDIALGTIAGVNIQANTIDSNNIKPLSIPNSDLSGGITLSKLGQSGASLNQVAQWNGTNWAPGTVSGGGGITGSGTAGQVAFWTGASAQSGSNSLFWDNTNNRLGIGVANPSWQLQMTGFKPMLLPLWGIAQRDLSPVQGVFGYSVTANTLEWYNGTAWVNAVPASGALSTDVVPKANAAGALSTSELQQISGGNSGTLAFNSGGTSRHFWDHNFGTNSYQMFSISSGPQFIMRRAGTNYTSPTAVTSATLPLGAWIGQAYNNAAYREAVAIRFNGDGAQGATNYAGRIEFCTSNGSAQSNPKMTINKDGKLILGLQLASSNGESHLVDNLNTFYSPGNATIYNQNLIGSANLANAALAAGTSWAVTGDAALVSDAATFTFSSGVGTLTQVSGNYLIAAVGERRYKLTLTFSSVTAGGGTLSLTTDYANTVLAINVQNGPQTYYFTSATSPGNFVLSATQTTGQAFTVDNINLTEVIGGTVSASRLNLWGNRASILGTATGIRFIGFSATSADNALTVQNSTPSTLYNIRNDGQISYWATNTASGTTGAQTINRPSGTVNFAAGATTLVVTNSLVTTSSLVFHVVRTNDATATVKNIVCAAGSFTITLTAAATAETSVGFFVIN